MTPADVPTVFVVDDDAGVRASIQGLLKSAKLRCASFGTAEEFLRNKPPGGPSCLVLDVSLPGLNGLDLQRELAEAGIQIPIMAFTVIGISPWPVMKMMGICMPASASSRCKSRPLSPGRLTSRTRQLGPPGGLLRKNSSAVPKDAHRNFADFSNPWMDARTPASSSTTNTVGTSAGVIQAPRPWSVD